jgi:hypothetical protein
MSRTILNSVASTEDVSKLDNENSLLEHRMVTQAQKKNIYISCSFEGG